MRSVDLLMTSPILPIVSEELQRSFTLHRLWEHENEDRFLSEVAPRVRGVVTSSASGYLGAAFFERLPHLEIVASFGAGFDNIDAAEATRRGIVVTNTPGVLDEDVADLAVALLLATLRQIPQADRFVRAGKWLEAPFPLSPTLRGRNVGIVGLGRIGKAIARRLEGFGVSIGYHGRTRQPDAIYTYHSTLLGLATNCDLLVVVAPGGEATRHLIDAHILEALGPTGVLINVSRGSVVDERALITALRNGTIQAAGLDVYEDEPRVPQDLVTLKNVVLLPHIGSATVYARNAMARLLVDNVISWFSGTGALTPILAHTTS